MYILVALMEMMNLDTEAEVSIYHAVNLPGCEHY